MWALGGGRHAIDHGRVACCIWAKGSSFLDLKKLLDHRLELGNIVQMGGVPTATPSGGETMGWVNGDSEKLSVEASGLRNQNQVT